jgi:ribosome-associated protein
VADGLDIGRGVTIPLDEFEMRASRASGPGGQHVNTSDTRVEVRFDVANSPSLPEAVRALLLDRLGDRLSRAGIVRVVAQGHRSQLRNREAALARMASLLSRALEEQPPRLPSRPTVGARLRRRRDKQLRGSLKRSRGPVDDE